MKIQESFQLIDGNFSTKESREILQNIFLSKINFHEMKNFSSQERYGKEDEIAIKRIPQLKNSLEKILKMLAILEVQDKRLQIKSEIVLSLIESDQDV